MPNSEALDHFFIWPGIGGLNALVMQINAQIAFRWAIGAMKIASAELHITIPKIRMAAQSNRFSGQPHVAACG
jgi:hypothetical protein